MLLVSVALANVIVPSFAADTLAPADFLSEDWYKTIDFFDYVRQYAASNNITLPYGSNDWHAYMYMTYVNTSGLHMLYAGSCNVSFGAYGTFTMPMQTFMMHYKTNNRTRDVLMAQTFLMLLAFNESSDSIYPNSPDMNDTLWSSFSMGFDFSNLNASIPALNCQTTTIPLTHTADKLNWSWGMKYTNLTSIWWRTWIAPNNHTHYDLPVALATYDELNFTYNLAISPETHTATLTENHVIGRIRQLWTFAGWLGLIHYDHYNATGHYDRTLPNPNETWKSDETVYDFIQNNQIKMSIVNFQTSILADRSTYSLSSSGQNVTDADRDVGNSGITTYADDGEKIFDASFGTKQTYKLYNYTANQNETAYNTYDSTARTCQIGGFAENTGLFQHQINLMKFLPLLVVHMYPGLYLRALNTITNMSRANYFYLIAYPTYSGYRVEHDPTVTVYLTTSTAGTNGETVPPNWAGLIVVLVLITAIIVAAVLVMRRRKPKQSAQPLKAS